MRTDTSRTEVCRIASRIFVQASQIAAGGNECSRIARRDLTTSIN